MVPLVDERLARYAEAQTTKRSALDRVASDPRAAAVKLSVRDGVTIVRNLSELAVGSPARAGAGA